MEDSIIIKGGSQCKVKPVIVVPRNYPGSLHTSISLFHYCVTSVKTTITTFLLSECLLMPSNAFS